MMHGHINVKYVTTLVQTW